MRRERIVGAMSRWQTWRWVLEDVIPLEDGVPAGSRLLSKNEDAERWLHAGYKAEPKCNDRLALLVRPLAHGRRSRYQQ